MNKRIIHTVFENQVNKAPWRIAVTEGNRQLTYRELNSAANKLAHSLKSLGLEKEAVVAAIAPPGINLVIMLLAIFKAGGIYMPLDTAFSKKQLKQALLETETNYLLVDERWEDDIKTLLVESDSVPKYFILVQEDHSFTAAVNQKNQFHRLLPGKDYMVQTNNPVLISEPQDGNYIFYTSGSTGNGKAVLGCHDSLSHFIHWELKEFAVSSDYRVSQLSQHTFDASLRDIWVPLCAGATLCIPPGETKENLASLVEWIRNNKISLVHTVPSVWRAIAREVLNNPKPGAKPGHLKHVLLAGEYITVQDIKYWKSAFGEKVEFVNLYGATEATMAKTFHRINDVQGDESQAVHAGKPISNTVIAVINEGTLCDVGEIGEIYIVTPFLTKGYYKNEEKTSKVFVQNPLVTGRKDIVYKTGDYGCYIDDQAIKVLGRIDDQVKVNGIRVELNEVKEVVLSCAGVEETEIVVCKDSFHQNSLICYFVGSTVNADTLKKYLEKELTLSVVPSYFIKMDEFPRTINGKVDKKALPKPEEILHNEEYEAPANETERKLEDICKQTLGMNRVDRNVSFFRIGGTSLKAMQYISAIYKEFGISINLRNIFEYDSIAALAAFVKDTLKDKDYNEIPAVPLSATYELSHAQKRLWLTDHFREEKLKYNMSFVSHIAGPLQVPVLEKAVAEVIKRHEMLRTTFVVADGVPQQKIHPADSGGTRISYTDISKYENKAELASEIIGEELTFSFDLQNGPLLRIALIQLADEEYNFVLSMHHIISDGWSVEVLVKELFILYQSFSRNEENPLNPLRIHYKDFASWQNNQLKGELLQKLDDYWLNQFRDDPAPLVLPADFAGVNQVFLNGAIMEFGIDEALTLQLNELAQRNGASLFMVLMTMVKVLLSRYSGQRDIIVGTPAATRNHPELENQVGLYINVLPLRTVLKSEEDTFRTLLLKVKQNLLGALEHDLYPYDLLIEKLGLAKQESRFPLINVLVQSQFILGETVPVIPGLTITDCSLDSLTSKVDITFNFKQTAGIIKGAIEYDTSLFKRSTISRLIGNLQHIARTVAENDSLIIGDIKLLQSEEEKSEEENFKQLMMSMK